MVNRICSEMRKLTELELISPFSARMAIVRVIQGMGEMGDNVTTTIIPHPPQLWSSCHSLIWPRQMLAMVRGVR